MNVAARGVLIGMVLGDSYLNVRRRVFKGKYEYESAEMRTLHGPAQADYCYHKAGLVRKYLGGKFKVHQYKNGPGGKYKAYAFSVSNGYFKTLKKWVYPNGKKTFTKHVLNMLTPEGIAIWYMDDGHARVNVSSRGYIKSVATNIATMCSRQEVDDIISWFSDVHKIEFKPRFDKRRPKDKAWFIEANTEHSRWFAHLVQPFIIPSMLYKLRHVADLNSHERRTPVGVCVKCGSKIYDNRRKGLCNACYSRKYYQRTKKHWR